MNRLRRMRCIFPFLILGLATSILADEESRIEKVKKLREALDLEDYRTAKTFLTEDPRVWYDSREGEGLPWTLKRGRWKNWDEHFNGKSTPQGPLKAAGRKIWADFFEVNDYFHLIGRGGGYFRKTWFFDGEGKIEGYMISAVPDAPDPGKGRGEEFEAWARENAPQELAYLRPGGRIDPTGDRARRTRALLLRWRESIGEPVKAGTRDQVVD